MSHHEHHEHDNDDEIEGIALGIRIIDVEGELYYAEAEISPYVDQATELGATLVFHPLAGLDPIADDDAEEERAVWHVDIDDELTRKPADSMPDQFQAIARQLRDLTEDELRDYLKAAQSEA